MSPGHDAAAPRGAASTVTPLLAFDTSTERLAVAALGPRGICAINAAGGAAASSTLLPQIHAALSAAGLVLADLVAIGFGRGPGAFTGLRTSCAVAQGLGFGLGRPLLPLDSLLVVAEDALHDDTGALAGGRDEAAGRATGTVAVAMDARMDEVYGALYRRCVPPAAAPGAGPACPAWAMLSEPALYTLAAWNARLEEHAAHLDLLAGSALVAFGARLHRVPGARAVPAERDRARALLRLAANAWRAGAAVDAAAALPLYLRDKVALTTAEREPMRAALPAKLPGQAGR